MAGKSAEGVWLVSESTIEHLSATPTATKILDKVHGLRNAKVSDPAISEITTSFRSLINYCNANLLKDLPVDIVYKPTRICYTEIKSWYFPDLNLSNIHDYIINTFENLERNSYQTQIETSNRFIDAMQVLVDYFNAVVRSGTDSLFRTKRKKVG